MILEDEKLHALDAVAFGMNQLVDVLVEGEVFIVNEVRILEANVELGHLRVLNLFFAQLADIFALGFEVVEVVQSDHIHNVVRHFLDFHLDRVEDACADKDVQECL